MKKTSQTRHPMATIARHVVYNLFPSVVEATQNFNAYRATYATSDHDKQPVSWTTLQRYLGATIEDPQYGNGGPVLYQQWVAFCVKSISTKHPSRIKIDKQEYVVLPCFNK